MRKFRVIPKYPSLTKKEGGRARSEISKKYKQKNSRTKKHGQLDWKSPGHEVQ